MYLHQIKCKSFPEGWNEITPIQIKSLRKIYRQLQVSQHRQSASEEQEALFRLHAFLYLAHLRFIKIVPSVLNQDIYFVVKPAKWWKFFCRLVISDTDMNRLIDYHLQFMTAESIHTHLAIGDATPS